MPSCGAARFRCYALELIPPGSKSLIPATAGGLHVPFVELESQAGAHSASQVSPAHPVRGTGCGKLSHWCSWKPKEQHPSLVCPVVLHGEAPPHAHGLETCYARCSLSHLMCQPVGDLAVFGCLKFSFQSRVQLVYFYLRVLLDSRRRRGCRLGLRLTRSRQYHFQSARTSTQLRDGVHE